MGPAFDRLFGGESFVARGEVLGPDAFCRTAIPGGAGDFAGPVPTPRTAPHSPFGATSSTVPANASKSLASPNSRYTLANRI